MTPNILKELRARVSEYADIASLKRNSHMNRWRGEDPSKEETSEFIAQFLSLVPEFPCRDGVSFYEHLVLHAQKRVAAEALERDELKKGILVDYINWAAGRFYCMDLGLYTSDL